MNKEYIRLSRKLSLYLRHKPELIDLSIDTQGWCFVDELISKMQMKKQNINKNILDYIVENNDKKRFAFSNDKKKIRASQGHTIKHVSITYDEIIPPDILYHGTPTKNINSIKNNGLLKQKRHHVHLSKDIETAKKVGSRRGKSCVFLIDSIRMHKDGHKFFISDNDVYLTEYVSAKYLILDKIIYD